MHNHDFDFDPTIVFPPDDPDELLAQQARARSLELQREMVDKALAKYQAYTSSDVHAKATAMTRDTGRMLRAVTIATADFIFNLIPEDKR